MAKTHHIDLTNDRIFPIIGKIFSHPYNWGGNRLIPHTLGFIPKQDTPYAEYWLGVHKKAPSQVLLPDGTTIALDQLIAANPEGVLNKKVTKQFGELPFLFKLLDAGEMLSPQVHPNKEQAEEGFAREEKKGIALSDPKRTYLDRNQKAEFAIVMDTFWLLHGFRHMDDLDTLLHEVKELSFLIPFFEHGNYKRLYKHVMVDMSNEEVNERVHALAERILPRYTKRQLDKTHPDYWAAKAMTYMHMVKGHYDRGIFSIYFLNLIRMEPGQAIFQNYGVLHAYLEGPIIEVMANSDNVARGGITNKYINVDELMKLTIFTDVTPKIITGRRVANETFYDAPLQEFVVSKIQPDAEHLYKNTAYSAEIVMGMEGNALLVSQEKTVALGKGKSAIIFAGTPYQIRGSEKDVVFRTSVPYAQ